MLVKFSGIRERKRYIHIERERKRVREEEREKEGERERESKKDRERETRECEGEKMVDLPCYMVLRSLGINSSFKLNFLFSKDALDAIGCI